METPVYEYHYAARHLERLPIGTLYPQQVARIKALRNQLYSETKALPKLVTDATGVGRPVIDMLKSAELSPAAVMTTGGDTVSSDYRVPQRDLVSVVQVLLQSERLKIVKGLPEASTLTSELLAFKVSISLKGHGSYGNDVGPWRENPHDDMVLTVALACWYGRAYAYDTVSQIGVTHCLRSYCRPRRSSGMTRVEDACREKIQGR